MDANTTPLLPEHLADLRKSGFSDETIAKMGVYSVGAIDFEQLLGFKPFGAESGLVFPYPGRNGFFRVKVFPTSSSGPKYLQRAGTGVHPYVPNGVEKIFQDPYETLWWTEGEKKAEKAWQEGLFTIALGGLSNWFENKQPAAWIEEIAHGTRKEILCPDSDVWSHKDRIFMVYAFGQTLAELGAEVHVAVLPPKGDGSKQGLDDYLVAHGKEDLLDKNKVKLIPLRNPTFKKASERYPEWKRRREWEQKTESDLNEEPLSETEKLEVEKLLNDPKIIGRFLTDAQRIGCVGEDRNKTLIFLSCASAKLNAPISLEIRGESAGGKNTLAEIVSSFFPPKDIIHISYLSARALLYWREKDTAHKVLIIAERAGGENADYSIRTMQSEKKLIVFVAEKIDGKIQTQKIEIPGPIAVIETTTEAHLDPQNASRQFEIFIDESEEQTERIFKVQNREAEGETVNPEPTLRIWREAIHQLKPCRVVIPFASKIEFPTKPLRVRRDHPRFLSLIEVSAFLHQRQRRWLAEDVVQAELYDYAVAYELTKDLLQQITQGINPKLKRLVETAQSLDLETFKVSDLRPVLKLSDDTIQRWAKEAERLGLFELQESGKGKPKIWALGRPIEEGVLSLPSVEKMGRLLTEGTSAPPHTSADGDSVV